MSESTAAAPAAAKASFWEDLIDIYLAPAAVFRRREHTSVWPPMLFVAITIGVIFFATFNTLQPAFDAEFTRASAKAIAKNAAVTPDAMNKIRDVWESVTKYGITVVMMVTMFILGVVTWLVGRLVGSKQTFQAALVVAAWAYMPRVLGVLIGGIQGLLMDPAKLTGAMSVTLSPARFMDPDTANPLLLQLMGRLDLITLWVTVLLSVGVYVTGKVSKSQAVAFGVLIWVVGALPALRQGYMAM